MDILKKYDSYVLNQTGQSLKPEEVLTFFLYNYFSQKFFIDIPRTRDEDEEKMAEGMEKLKVIIFEHMTKKPRQAHLVFPVLRFFYNDFTGWTGSRKYSQKETKNAIDFIEDLYIQIEKVLTTTGGYR